MKSEKNKLWELYGKDCNTLWIEYKRSVNTSPSKEYLADKVALKEQLDIDLARTRTRIS